MDKNDLPGQAHAFHGDNGKSGEANAPSALTAARVYPGYYRHRATSRPSSGDSVVMGHPGR